MKKEKKPLNQQQASSKIKLTAFLKRIKYRMAKIDEGSPDIFGNSFKTSKGFKMIKHQKTNMRKKAVKY